MKFLRIFGYVALIGTAGAFSFNPALAQDTVEDTIEIVPETGAATPEAGVAAPETGEVASETATEPLVDPDCSEILAAIDAEIPENIDRTTQTCVAELGAPGLSQEQIDEIVLSLVEQMTSRDISVGIRPVVADAIRALSALTSPAISDGLVQIASSYEEGDGVEVAATDQAASEQ